MNLRDALRTVLDLAEQNVIDDDDMQEQANYQDECCSVVEALLQILHNDKLADAVGKDLIDLCNMKVKTNGRVDLRGGDKTPRGVARTVFHLYSQWATAHAEGKENVDAT